jgi:hemolysin III
MSDIAYTPPYTPQQELANSLTHGIGILLSMVSIPVLIAIAVHNGCNAVQLFALGIYSLSLLLVYSASTLYHALQGERIKRAFKIIDHICIYFLIAGSSTALVVKYLDPQTTTNFLVAQWSLVAVGIAFKLFFTGKFKLLSTLFYLLLGWMTVFILRPLFAQMSWSAIHWLWGCAICYTIGTVFYLWKKPYYQHAIWHLFVLGGSVCHYAALLYCF